MTAPTPGSGLGPCSTAGRPDAGVKYPVGARVGWSAAEAVVAVASALGFLGWCRSIQVDPLDAVGRVSGLAQLQFRFAVACGSVVVAAVVARRWIRVEPVVIRLACAAVAGLTTGLIAGGAEVALLGTRWPLSGNWGDVHALLAMVDRLSPQHVSDSYPPGILFVTKVWARVSHQPAGYAYQGIQLVGTALFGPATYLAWRLSLRPVWALGIGVVSCLPFIDPVRPNAQLSLAVLVPLLVAYVRRLRRLGDPSLRVAMRGAGYGLGFGMLFLLYSGWFVWIAPGAVLTVLLLAPWRRAWRTVLAYLTTTVVAFVVVSWIHLRGILRPTGGLSDRYLYFDTYVDPAYIAMWRSDRGDPAKLAQWPPPGELAGVGVFTLLLAAGAFAAVLLAWRSSTVAVLGAGIVGAWLMRMWIAGQMYSTGTVQLYPRTTLILLYCMILLTGVAIRHALILLRRRMSIRAFTAPVGLLLLPLVFLLASAGSATADKYMPRPDVRSFGWFAYVAQMMELPDGTCSVFAPSHGADIPVDGNDHSLFPHPCRRVQAGTP
jgi:hypothetical protein